METRTRASRLVAAVAVVLVLAALPGCGKKPADNATGSTDTVQSTTTQTGTTATETGGGAPVTTTTTTTTTATGTADATGTR
jgi:hypothetical protein